MVGTEVQGAWGTFGGSILFCIFILMVCMIYIYFKIHGLKLYTEMGEFYRV